jgi:hypothetical protein
MIETRFATVEYLRFATVQPCNRAKRVLNPALQPCNRAKRVLNPALQPCNRVSHVRLLADLAWAYLKSLIAWAFYSKAAVN